MTIYSPSASLDVSATPHRRSLLRRFLDAIMQGRQRNATAGLARYLHDHQHSLDAEVRSELERRLVAQQSEPAPRLRPRADEPGSGRVSPVRSRASSDALCARTLRSGRAGRSLRSPARPIAGVLLALTTAVALSAAGSDAFADPQPTTFALACALKEVKVITLIEEHGEARDLPSDSLADAGMAMLRARAICYEGRVTEALALYDGILTLGPVVSARAQ